MKCVVEPAVACHPNCAIVESCRRGLTVEYLKAVVLAEAVREAVLAATVREEDLYEFRIAHPVESMCCVVCGTKNARLDRHCICEQCYKLTRKEALESEQYIRAVEVLREPSGETGNRH